MRNVRLHEAPVDSTGVEEHASLQSPDAEPVPLVHGRPSGEHGVTEDEEKDHDIDWTWCAWPTENGPPQKQRDRRQQGDHHDGSRPLDMNDGEKKHHESGVAASDEDGRAEKRGAAQFAVDEPCQRAAGERDQDERGQHRDHRCLSIFPSGQYAITLASVSPGNFTVRPESM